MKPEELLLEEKLSLLSYMKKNEDSFMTIFGTDDVSGKNAETSVRLRKEGNALYARASPLISEESILKIWHLYSASIIFAPHNSEELALSYGNKSALSLRICSFDTCIKDCDQALSITSCNYLKVKLLYRKAKSLYMLNKSPKEVCEEALQLLEKLKLDKQLKNDYKKNLTELYRSSISSSHKCKLFYREHDNCNDNELLNFERSQEIPCASKSVAIKYNEKWGRHIVATEDIQPGEIIAVEKSCIHFPHGEKKYLFCGNCMNYLFMYSVIPCEYCTHNVYCSESCRKEAWKKFHQFECRILILLNFNEALQNNFLYPLRMFLLGIYQVGGLEQMKEQLLEIENTEDARKKGFSNGIFEDDKVKSILSLHYRKDYSDEDKIVLMGISCAGVYLLAKYTTFFAEKINSELEMFCNQDILFSAALLLRCCYICNNLNLVLNDTDPISSYLGTFSNLLNHSCDPNVNICTTKSCQNICIACYPIKKDSQLFTAYRGNTFLCKDKECRQKDLQKFNNFTCDCVACKENWSVISLPSLKVVLKIVPSLRTSILKDIVKGVDNPVEIYANSSSFHTREMFIAYLKLLSQNFTVYCQEYFTLLESLKDIYASLKFSKSII